MNDMKTGNSCSNTRRKRWGVFSSAFIIFLLIGAFIWYRRASETVLRISDWKTGEIYVEVPAKAGDDLFFGWMHSLEKIPWNEYYHIAPDNTLVLDTISFPAFGAGIPENKGNICRTENGLIYMDEIEQEFDEFVWINSHYAVRNIKLNGTLITSGRLLPEHTRLRLIIERRVIHDK